MSSPPGAPPDRPAAPYDGRATADDVFHCFRLLLGRHPNPEEWRGHLSHAGEPLDAVVASYVNSLEFSRRGLTTPDPAAGLAVAEGEGFRLYASPVDSAVGRHVLAGAYEGEVAAVFRAVLRPGMGVLDVGANIGYFTMLAAALVGPAGRVFAVEPNPDNARMIEASRVLNGFAHVTVLQAAAGRDAGLLALNASFSNGTTSALEARGEAILAARTVARVPLDGVVPADVPVALLKADAEGAEYNALLGCREIIRRDRPVIVTEFSPGLLRGISGIAGEDYLRWLMGLGYDLSVIRPDGPPVPAADPEAVMAAYHARGVDHVDILARPRRKTGLGAAWDRVVRRPRASP